MPSFAQGVLPPPQPIVDSAPSVVGIDIIEEGGRLVALDRLGTKTTPPPATGPMQCAFMLTQDTSGRYVQGPGFVDYGVLEASHSNYQATASCNFGIANMLSSSALYYKGTVLSQDSKLCSSGTCTEAVSAGAYSCTTGPNCAGYYYARGHASFYTPTRTFATSSPYCTVTSSGHTLVCDLADNGVTVSQTIPPGVHSGG